MVTPLKNKIAIWFDFNKSLIIKGFLASCLFLSPVVLTYFGVESKIVFTVLAIAALAPFFWLNKKELFWFGGFSGVAWFYWIGFSLYYYGLMWLFVPFLILLFFYYASLFWLIGWSSEKFFWLRIATVGFLFDYLAPLGFDWMKPEMIYGGSYFGALKYELILLLLGIAVIIHAKKVLKPLGVFFIFLAISYGDKTDSKKSLINIKLIETDIRQDQKWDESFKLQITKENLRLIDEAIKDDADLVVMPETAFPYFLNEAPEVVETLKEKSFESPILTGALKLENGSVYNSSYFFKDGQMQIFDKVVAVPFGEVNPLPKFMSKIVNNLFFNGAEDYKTADKPSDFEINGVKFRNAICYEATNERIYLDYPEYIVAISNNAWFVPSLEPTIQKMLMRHLFKKYKTTIYHTSNKSKAFVLN